MNKMKSAIYLSIFSLSACSQPESKIVESDEKVPSEIVKKEKMIADFSLSQPEILQQLSFQNLPYTDSTNFDNFEFRKALSVKEMKALKVDKLPECTDLSGVKCELRHKVRFSDNFTSVVLTVQVSDTERKTYVVNYDRNFNFVDNLLIAYDEIAESCSRTESLADKKKIRVSNKYFCNENGEVVEQKSYTISENGRFIKSN